MLVRGKPDARTAYDQMVQSGETVLRELRGVWASAEVGTNALVGLHNTLQKAGAEWISFGLEDEGALSAFGQQVQDYVRERDGTAEFDLLAQYTALLLAGRKITTGLQAYLTTEAVGFTLEGVMYEGKRHTDFNRADMLAMIQLMEG